MKTYNLDSMTIPYNTELMQGTLRIQAANKNQVIVSAVSDEKGNVILKVRNKTIVVRFYLVINLTEQELNVVENMSWLCDCLQNDLTPYQRKTLIEDLKTNLLPILNSKEITRLRLEQECFLQDNYLAQIKEKQTRTEEYLKFIMKENIEQELLCSATTHKLNELKKELSEQIHLNLE